jgi:hypothetical protein
MATIGNHAERLRRPLRVRPLDGWCAGLNRATHACPGGRPGGGRVMSDYLAVVFGPGFCSFWGRDPYKEKAIFRAMRERDQGSGRCRVAYCFHHAKVIR